MCRTKYGKGRGHHRRRRRLCGDFEVEMKTTTTLLLCLLAVHSTLHGFPGTALSYSNEIQNATPHLCSVIEVSYPNTQILV